MKKTIFPFAAFLTAVLCAFAVYIYWHNQSPPVFAHISYIAETRGPASVGKSRKVRPAAVLFKIKDKLSDQEKQKLNEALAGFDIQVEKKLMKGKIHLAKILKQKNLSEQEVAQSLLSTGAVAFAEPDAIVTPNFTGNDTYLANQWHHSQIRSYEAWDTTMGNANVTVATCDTGVDANHEDLKSNLLPGYNSMDGNNLNLIPNHPHGTMTAGVIAAVANNGIGVSGVAGHVRILPIRISNSTDGTSTYSAMTSCIEYAADHGAKIVNMSYSGAESSSIDLAAQHLRAAGGLLVMSAGNAGTDLSANPDFASFLIVGATDANDSKPDWSNYGKPVDLMAPGVDIFTTTLGGYAYASGTSFSAPLVSGAAALILSLNPSFTPDQVENFLLTSAKPMGSGSDDPNFGHGRLDVAAALAMAQRALPAPTLTITSGPTVSDLTSSTATISWSLSDFATGQVQYGTSSAYGLFSTPETSFQYKSHVQVLNGLSPGTTYHFKVISKNANGTEVASADQTFSTIGTAPSPSPSPAPAPNATTVLTLATPSLSVQAGQNVTLTTRFNAVPMKLNYQVFIHFVDAKQVKANFNGDYAPTVPTTKWSGLVTRKKTVLVPATTPPGVYTVRIGLYENVAPYLNRASLTMGPGVTVDDSLRYTVGTLTVKRKR